MNLISEHNFSVVSGEQVVIRVTPDALQGYFVAAMLDGQLLEPSGGVPAEYSFTATKSAGMVHLCVFEAIFPSDPPAGAVYQFQVGGAGLVLEEFTLRADGQANVVTLSFQVEGFSDDWQNDPPIIIQREEIAPPEPWG